MLDSSSGAAASHLHCLADRAELHGEIDARILVHLQPDSTLAGLFEARLLRDHAIRAGRQKREFIETRVIADRFAPDARVDICDRDSDALNHRAARISDNPIQGRCCLTSGLPTCKECSYCQDEKTKKFCQDISPRVRDAITTYLLPQCSDSPLSRQCEKFLIGQSRKFRLTADGLKDGTVAVDILTVPEFRAGSPRPLFELRSTSANTQVIMAPDEQETGVRLHAVVNWFEELRRLVPAGGQ